MCVVGQNGLLVNIFFRLHIILTYLSITEWRMFLFLNFYKWFLPFFFSNTVCCHLVMNENTLKIFLFFGTDLFEWDVWNLSNSFWCPPVSLKSHGVHAHEWSKPWSGLSMHAWNPKKLTGMGDLRVTILTWLQTIFALSHLTFKLHETFEHCALYSYFQDTAHFLLLQEMMNCKLTCLKRGLFYQVNPNSFLLRFILTRCFHRLQHIHGTIGIKHRPGGGLQVFLVHLEKSYPQEHHLATSECQ